MAGFPAAAGSAAESQTLYFDPPEEDDDFEKGDKDFVVVHTMVSSNRPTCETIALLDQRSKFASFWTSRSDIVGEGCFFFLIFFSAYRNRRSLPG